LSPFGKPVFNVRRVATKIDALNQLVLFHVAETRDQSAAADWKQSRMKFHGALWTRGEISRHQQSPFVADHLQRAGNWTTINFPSSHIIALSREAALPHSVR